MKFPISKVGVLSSSSTASPDGVTSNFSDVIASLFWLFADAINLSTSTSSIVKLTSFTTIGNLISLIKLPLKSYWDLL